MRLKLIILCVFITIAPVLAVIPDRVAVTDSSLHFSELVNSQVSAYFRQTTDIGWNRYSANRVILNPSTLATSGPESRPGSFLRYNPPLIYTISLDAYANQVTDLPDNTLTPMFDTGDSMVGAALASALIDNQYSDVGISPSKDFDHSKLPARTFAWLLGVGLFSLFGLRRRAGRSETERWSEVGCGCEADACEAAVDVTDDVFSSKKI